MSPSWADAGLLLCAFREVVPILNTRLRTRDDPFYAVRWNLVNNLLTLCFKRLVSAEHSEKETAGLSGAESWIGTQRPPGNSTVQMLPIHATKPLQGCFAHDRGIRAGVCGVMIIGNLSGNVAR
jgi:hypothetical protein